MGGRSSSVSGTSPSYYYTAQHYFHAHARALRTHGTHTCCTRMLRLDSSSLAPAHAGTLPRCATSPAYTTQRTTPRTACRTLTHRAPAARHLALRSRHSNAHASRLPAVPRSRWFGFYVGCLSRRCATTKGGRTPVRAYGNARA